MNGTTIRHRWGVQHDFRERNDKRPVWRTLGCGWIQYPERLPAHVDFWPANFLTRREARAAAKILTESSRKHSIGWRFREVRLRITVEDVNR